MWWIVSVHVSKPLDTTIKQQIKSSQKKPHRHSIHNIWKRSLLM